MVGGKKCNSLLICLKVVESSLSLYATKTHKLSCQEQQTWPVHLKFKTRTQLHVIPFLTDHR